MGCKGGLSGVEGELDVVPSREAGLAATRQSATEACGMEFPLKVFEEPDWIVAFTLDDQGIVELADAHASPHNHMVRTTLLYAPTVCLSTLR